MIAPVGGGGLLSGLAVGAAAAGSQAVLLGCEPERYRSVSASLAAERIVRVVHQPTLADGLAVNLESSSITFPLIRDLVRSVESLDEEELAAATLALLVHESLLVEPAGAAAVVACLRLAQRGQLDGPVALPLCGGNLHHTTLTRIQRFPYGDPELIRLLDLRGRAVTELPVSRATTSGQPAAGPSEDPRSGSRSGPRSGSEEAQLDLDAQLGSWAGTLATVLAEVEEYTEYCANAGVLVDQDIIQTLRRDCAAAAQRLAEARAQLATAADADTVARAEIVLRHAATVAGSARAALDWCSPSYAQATVSQFFDVGAQDNPTVNYERYESTACQRVESQLLEVLGLSPQRQAVTATSSGMAAYSLIEAFLLRHRLRPGDTVLLAPYVYFEASEQLLSLPSVKCVTASAYSVDGLLAEVRQHRPRCLFIDPITNTADQRLIDIPALLRGLAAATSDPLTVVIDGTMASAALSGSVFDTAPHIEVLYYESCSKYLQLGMDVAMAGVVATPVELRHAFDRIRRNTGTILYRHSAQLFPVYDRAYFLRRMHRICGNAATVARELCARPDVRAVTRVVHPCSGEHPDHDIAQRLPYAGGCVTFAFHEVGGNHRDQLEALIDHLLDQARRAGLHLTKGVSFGFNTPRVSAAASMSESEPPFLRLYAGDRSSEQVRLLARVTGDAIAGFARSL
jgi:cystathionine beta-lyase/cystathionine gamma-synthase